MCSDCNASASCDCTGGSILAACQCEQGVACPVCNHEPSVSVTVAQAPLSEVLSMDMLADEIEFE